MQSTYIELLHSNRLQQSTDHAMKSFVVLPAMSACFADHQSVTWGVNVTAHTSIHTHVVHVVM
jgi:hypothetical protein